MLGGRSVSRLASIRAARGCDWLFLNPPFSRPVGARGIHARFGMGQIFCSVGMSFLLRSLAIVGPRLGAVAIVPESLMYSDLDRDAREALMSSYAMRIIEETSCYTFKGARARALIVRIGRGRSETSDDVPLAEAGLDGLPVNIIRGGLPVFEAARRRTGTPFLHSTSLPRTSGSLETSKLPLVTRLTRGIVRGSVVLLPRVGLPGRDQLVGVRLRDTVQLSDCVIALSCRNYQEARRLGRYLRHNYSDLCDIYRGTGARYVTCARLESWLRSRLGNSVTRSRASEAITA